MNLLYIISKKNNIVNPATLDSIKEVFLTGDELETDIPSEGFESTINDLIATNYEAYKSKGITHVVIVPDESTITKQYRSIVDQYVKGTENVVYLPMVQYFEKVENADPSFRGLLNTCMWKPYGFNNDYGFVNQDLAVKQIDTTLYGAIIPLEVLKQYPFKTKIKHYAFFEYISRVINKGVIVRGIPKITAAYVADDTLRKVSQEEKVKYFTACQKAYLFDNDGEVEDNVASAAPTA